MGSRIVFAAGPEDMKELNAFIRSLGMQFVPPGPDIEYSEDETVLGGCFISAVPKEELKSWGKINRWYYEALDPILPFTRSVYQAPYLRPGDIYWNNDTPEMAVQTKATFQKIARWIRKNWPKPNNHDSYYGPEARRMVFEEGVIFTSLVPGVTLTQIPVSPD